MMIDPSNEMMNCQKEQTPVSIEGAGEAYEFKS